MRVGSRTDKGRVREQNEDSYGYKEQLFVVADGMGGHQAGEIASAIVVETILAMELSDPVDRELEKAILQANEAILAEVSLHPELSGMGTTVVAMVIDQQIVYVAHVGDSRIYRLHEGQLCQLTHDHSLVAELVKSGEITASEARYHPQRNILTQALGSRGELKIDFQQIELVAGDKYLLCSDGLSGMLEETAMQEVLQLEEEPQFLAELLVSMANDKGGSDNITAIVIEA